MPAWRRTFQSITGKPFCPIAAIAAPETFRRARLADENPARLSQSKGRFGRGLGNPQMWANYVTRAPLLQTQGCAQSSSRNVRHDQPVRHALVKAQRRPIGVTTSTITFSRLLEPFTVRAH